MFRDLLGRSTDLGSRNSEKKERRSLRRRRRLVAERLCDRKLLASDLMNAANPLDVNADENVTAADALGVINYINRQGSGEAIAPTQMFPDTNGDTAVTMLDALGVINGLQRIAEGLSTVEFVLSNPSVTNGSLSPGMATVSAQAALQGINNEGTIVGRLQGNLLDSEGNVVRNLEVDASRNDASFTGNPSQPMQVSGDFVTSGLPNGSYDLRLSMITSTPDVTATTNELVVADAVVVNDFDIGIDFGDIPVLEETPVVREIHARGGDDVRIEFSGSSVYVRMGMNSNGQLVVTDTNLAAGAINLGAMSLHDDLIIDAKGGGNVFILDGVTIPDDLLIDIGGGNNFVVLYNSQVRDDLNFDGAGGDDYLGIVNSAIGDVAKIHGKDGLDSIALYNVMNGDDLRVYGGDGTDYLISDTVRVGDDAIVRMGDHNDYVSARDALINDVADIKGGRDFDILAADSSVAARRLKADDFEDSQSPINVDAIIGDENTLEGVLSGLSSIMSSIIQSSHSSTSSNTSF